MIRDMGRPKKYKHPDFMTFDRDSGKYVVRNPITKKKRTFSGEAEAVKAAELLKEWVETERQAQALDKGRPSISALVNRWMLDKLQFMPWDHRTKANHLYKMERIKRELGHRPVARTDSMFLEEWLESFCRTADQFNKWRFSLVMLWKLAVAKHLAEANEPEKIEQRSTSKKLEMNQKVRQQLDLDGYRAIHKIAQPWLKIAMEQSLVTLQARQEVCNMRLDHYRDGWLFVIRDKTSGDSDMAFIKIAMTAQLEDILARSKDGLHSPYLIHRRPDMRKRRQINAKPHWTYVNPDYLSKGFGKARDKAAVYAHLKPAERPTFHEIRGLGARLYRAQGVAESAIQALMTHAHQRTTQIYLERGTAALTDEDYHAVSAPLNLATIGVKP